MLALPAHMCDLYARQAGRPGGCDTRPAPTSSIGEDPMSKATPNVRPAADLPKLDRTDFTRELWRSAYSMARRLLRHRPGHSAGEALPSYLDHGFRRFGFNALPIVRAA